MAEREGTERAIPWSEALGTLLAKWDKELREHGEWTYGHSLGIQMANMLRALGDRCQQAEQQRNDTRAALDGCRTGRSILAEQLGEAEAEVTRLREALDDERREQAWTDEEHAKAVAAIKASESMSANHYPSFQERVWWKEAQRAKAQAEARVQALEAQVAALTQERDHLTRKVGIDV